MGAPSSSTEQSQATTREVVKPSIAAEHSEAVPTKDKSGGGGVFAGSPTKWGHTISTLFGPSSHEKEETELETITRERSQSTTVAEPAAPSPTWGMVAARPRVLSPPPKRASIGNRLPNQGAPHHTASRLFHRGGHLSREASLRTSVESSDYDPFYTTINNCSRISSKAEGDRRSWSSTGN